MVERKSISLDVNGKGSEWDTKEGRDEKESNTMIGQSFEYIATKDIELGEEIIMGYNLK